VNESLCRALVAAGLGEDDIAARLGVDPKTVRRWLEGRVPYRRHRWALAAMLGANDANLWPGVRADGGRPRDVVAVYPRLDGVPDAAWRRLLGSAIREVAVLADCGMVLAWQEWVRSVLAERAGKGTRVRICLRDPDAARAREEVGKVSAGREALSLFAPLTRLGVLVRLHRGESYGCWVLADDNLLVVQAAWGIPAGRHPALHLRRGEGHGLFASYVDSFERTWASSRPT
jgi:hypothetical protein